MNRQSNKDEQFDDIPRETLYADLDVRLPQYNGNSRRLQEAPMAYNDAEYWKTDNDDSKLPPSR
jgi:hypothetical protein